MTTTARSAAAPPWLDGSASPEALSADLDIPQSLGYRAKVKLLGPPLTREALKHERLSKRLALGVLSSDCISSSAYGTEEMLIALLPAFGLAAFTILLPLTGVVLAVLLIVTLSYRDVVSIYTQTGGSYVVARENFGPVVAQIAAVALMLDYIVTVAVQTAAGTAALASAVPSLNRWLLEISIVVVAILFYGNLRGIREAGRTFAFPTYFFAGSLLVVIVAGVIREIMGDLPHVPVASGAYPVGHGEAVLGMGAVYVLLRAFANGGSSLTGLEAVSNGVSVFKKPEGRNARKTLVAMSAILGTLVLGVSWLAHETHATPYVVGTPTVISQVTKAALGNSVVGHIGFFVVQLATMLILWTGANTPFSGFPFLASFVAGDRFLPRQLTRRGHRLAFSNGIIVLAGASLVLLIGTDAKVNNLVAFYAIGVFTGFTLAGLGMARYFSVRKQGKWRRKVALNTASGIVSAVVVVVFAVVKFTEGAWLVVILFPIGVLALIRLNRQYRREAQALSHLGPSTGRPVISRSTVVVLVDEVDLATLGAISYGRSLRPTELRAVHFVVDSAHAEELRKQWASQPAAREVPLYLIDCPDRRLARAALELAARESAAPGTEVTLLLPRRTYARFLGRILHDRTADDIARAVSRMPRVVATIVPFDVDGLISRKARAGLEAQELPHPPEPEPEPAEVPPAPEGITHIADLEWRSRATLEGQVRSVRVAPLSGAPSLEVEVWDATGGMTLVFYGRRSIAGLEPGARVRATGTVGSLHGCLAVSNPSYELVGDEEGSEQESVASGR